MPPIRSAHDQARLDDALAALSAEHPDQWRPAFDWLVAHPTLARAELVAMVARGGGPAVMAVGRAAGALGAIGDPADVPALAAALARGGETAAWDFAQALATHRSPEALAALIEAATSGDRDVAQAAAGALGARRDEGGRATLETLLDHGATPVRFTAVKSLVELGVEPSRAALQRRQRIEKDGEVRGAIRQALRP